MEDYLTKIFAEALRKEVESNLRPPDIFYTPPEVKIAVREGLRGTLRRDARYYTYGTGFFALLSSGKKTEKDYIEVEIGRCWDPIFPHTLRRKLREVSEEFAEKLDNENQGILSPEEEKIVIEKIRKILPKFLRLSKKTIKARIKMGEKIIEEYRKKKEKDFTHAIKEIKENTLNDISADLFTEIDKGEIVIVPKRKTFEPLALLIKKEELKEKLMNTETNFSSTVISLPPVVINEVITTRIKETKTKTPFYIPWEGAGVFLGNTLRDEPTIILKKEDMYLKIKVMIPLSEEYKREAPSFLTVVTRLPASWEIGRKERFSSTLKEIAEVSVPPLIAAIEGTQEAMLPVMLEKSI